MKMYKRHKSKYLNAKELNQSNQLIDTDMEFEENPTNQIPQEEMKAEEND